MFKGKKCKKCEGKIKDSYDFCPFCGFDLSNPERDVEDFGMLGKNNEVKGYPTIGGGGFGITDRMVDSLFRGLMKTLEKQMKDVDFNQEVQSFPNGVRISLGTQGRRGDKVKKKQVKKEITQEQIKKMTGLPRAEAKADVRRFSDKVVYDLKTSGLESVDDVFVSKLESGYEIKAIGKKKVYVNSIPVNLPLKGYRLHEKGLSVEFGLQ